MQNIQLDHKTKSIVLKKDLIIKNKLLYEYFSTQPVNKREEIFKKALYIGTLALMEDRLAAFLAKTKNELGTELEHLKILFELKTEMFLKSAVKGKFAEKELVSILNDYFDEKEWKDYAILVGDNDGKYKNIKTGDILCFVDGKENKRIVIEAKFQKTLPIGDVSKRSLKNNTNNIWGQLLEAKTNREAEEAIIVFDSTISSTINDKFGPITFIPKVGFVTVIDSQSGNYWPLFATYNIIRSVILSKSRLATNEALIIKIIEKIIYEINQALSIKELVEENIKNNQKILSSLEDNLKNLELTKAYLEKLNQQENNPSKENENLYEFFTGLLATKTQVT